MPRFFAGDALGSVKSIRYSPAPGEHPQQWKADTVVLAEGGHDSEGKPAAVQRLAASCAGAETLLAAARADGSAAAYSISDGAGPSVVHEWTEARLKGGQRYVGLAMRERRVYSCTSNGALRLTRVEEDAAPRREMGVLPMRLRDWRLSADGETFAYGGDEVELSVWTIEGALSHRPETSSAASNQKRKRGDQLLPGEVWRAKNVPNDGLSLRQPVHITSLAYLQPSASAAHHHLLTGTQEGNVRRYDTRAARRPVADWKGVGKVGGVSTVEKGLGEHEVFVADHGCNLLALDVRNGHVMYGYKSLSGAVTSLAPAPSLLASVSQDRFLRLHSTFPPPSVAGDQQDQKGAVLDKVYMKAIPTAVVWDGAADAEDAPSAVDASDDEDGAEDDVWDGMEEAEDVIDAEEGHAKKRKRSRV